MKRIACILLALALCLSLTACRHEDPLADMPNPIATVTMENGDVMRFELKYHDFPNTVANFTKLANSGFYDGMDFYRVIPGVLIQSGAPGNAGTGNAGYTIRDEFSQTAPLSHFRGVISMCRTDEAHSASSQFFIMQGNYPEYDEQYVAFGTAMDEITLAAIDSIASQPIAGYYVPLRDQTILSIRVNTHGYELPEPKTIPIPEE